MDLATKPPYETVDFKALAQRDEAFNTIWQQHSGKLAFQDPATTKALTKALLSVDFGLQLEVPDDRLCPPVPNRWNYVSWIHALLDSTNPSYVDEFDPERQAVGLDIGTGASAIYSMLCLQSRPSWTMCATDIDKKSFESAARNLTINNLITRTKLIQTIETQPLIPLQYLGVSKLDFTICNPPFFADETDMRQSLSGEGKSARPNAVCTGSENEMVCRGGDLGFVTRMVDESIVLREQVTWYTSMLGKMSSAKAIIQLLREKDVTNWAVGSIDVGGGTKRWIVAWSFADYRPRNVSLYLLLRVMRLSGVIEHRPHGENRKRVPPLPNGIPLRTSFYYRRQRRKTHHRPTSSPPPHALELGLEIRDWCRRSTRERLVPSVPSRARA